MKLNTKAFALSGGILWAVCMFVLTLLAVYANYGNALVNAIANLYPWYTVTAAGAVVGAVLGFVDAFIGCWVFAWLYNKLAK